MEILKEALERNGFTYIGPCKICGGRGFEYQNKRVIAKIKYRVDQNNRMWELHITVTGWDHNGRRIPATLIDKKVPAHIENIDNILQRFTTDGQKVAS